MRQVVPEVHRVSDCKKASLGHYPGAYSDTSTHPNIRLQLEFTKNGTG